MYRRVAFVLAANSEFCGQFLDNSGFKIKRNVRLDCASSATSYQTLK